MKKAALFGIIFGFLLQKAGVAKYHVLIGQLLLEDFTVLKVMLSAIFTAMIGLRILAKSGQVKPQIKPFQPLANVGGGVIFGAGFALAGFCPGTGAAAFGQGDFETIFYIAGMILGSYLYAESSNFLDRNIKSRKEKGELTIPQLLKRR
jgi:uncharacterized protein